MPRVVSLTELLAPMMAEHDAVFRHSLSNLVPGIVPGRDRDAARSLAEALARAGNDREANLTFPLDQSADLQSAALRAGLQHTVETARYLSKVHAAFRRAKLTPSRHVYRALVRRWLRTPPSSLGELLRAAEKAKITLTDRMLVTAAKNAIDAEGYDVAKQIQRRLGRQKVPRSLWGQAAKRSLRRGDIRRAVDQLWVAHYDATPDRIVLLPANRRTGVPAECAYRWPEFGITIRRSDLLRIPFGEREPYVGNDRGISYPVKLDGYAIARYLPMLVALDDALAAANA